jgi:hypothetical protein
MAVLSTGEKTVQVAKPEKKVEVGRLDADDFNTDAYDAVIREDEVLSSGKLEWREVAWEGGLACGR